MSEITVNGIVGTYATVRGGHQPSKATQQRILSLELPKQFHFSEVADVRTDLYISMNNASQATQLGMAIYEYAKGCWTGKHQDGKFIISNSRTGEVYKVEYSPAITGKAHELREGATHEIIISYRKTIVRSWNGSVWSAPLKLSSNVDRAVNNGRQAKITAENWISILAHYVTGLKVTAGSGEFSPLVLEGYRKQAWKRAGGEWWNFPKAISHLCRKSEGGWVLETHQSGKPVALPVTMDRTTESKLLQAITG